MASKQERDSDIKTHAERKTWYDSYEDMTNEGRALSERDIDYKDGKQLSDEELSDLDDRGQPPVIINRIAPKVDFVVGSEIRTRTDPAARGRTMQDELAAEVITEAIRFVWDENDGDTERSAVTEDMLVPGTGIYDISAEPNYDTGEVDISVRQVPWDRAFYDPHSRFKDFRDAKFMGEVMWMDLEDAKEKWSADEYPQAHAVLEEAGGQFMASASTNQTHDDRPKMWVAPHGNRVRVKIVYMNYRVGKRWYVCTFTGNDDLEPPQLSPYVDDKGRSVPCLVMQSAYITRENVRYGIVRQLISAQDEINKRRSKALHLLNSRQTLAEDGAVEDIREMKAEMSKPDGHVVVRPGMRFEVLQTNDLATGQFQLLMDAKQEIDSQGANAALTGDDPRQQSGVAIRSRQEGGFIELEPVFASVRILTRRVFQQIYFRIRQFWNEERWIRVTDNPEAPKFVGLNVRTTKAALLAEQGQQVPDLNQLAMVDPALAQDLAQEVIVNNVAEMDVDIIIDESPDVITLQEQQFAQLAQILPQLPPGSIDPRSMVEVLIEASSLRNKKALLEKLSGASGASPEQQAMAAQQQAQTQQLAMQGVALELEQKAADVNKTKAETMSKLAQVERDTMDSAVDRARFSLASVGLTGGQGDLAQPQGPVG